MVFTLRTMRYRGARDVLLTCLGCGHSARASAEGLPEETPVESLAARRVCSRCGARHPEVKPAYRDHKWRGRAG